MKPNKKIYFASDFHLGIPTFEASAGREKLIVQWLDEIKGDAEEIFLVGDIFDFWFEYKHVIPKGFTRLLGKIAEISDSGIPVHFFTGNHDVWMYDYFPKELGVNVFREPISRTFNGKKFYIGHGDGLGPGDHGYKFLKKIFNNKFCQWMYARIHPNLGVSIAKMSSIKSRMANGTKDETFHGEDKEWLAIYSRELLQKEHFDYFVFGHRHLPLEIKLSNNSMYINLGEWVNYNTYGVFDGERMELKTYNK